MAVVISPALRDLLIEHIDWPIPFRVRDVARHAVVKAALGREWLYTQPYGVFRPTHTVLTEKGRAVLAAALADWAEAMVRAGFEQEKPTKIAI